MILFMRENQVVSACDLSDDNIYTAVDIIVFCSVVVPDKTVSTRPSYKDSLCSRWVAVPISVFYLLQCDTITNMFYCVVISKEAVICK